MNNTELLNKTISTNEKVILTYKDMEEKDYTTTLTSSPKIQLSELKDVIVENSNTIQEETQEDTTTAKGILPKTGINKVIIFSLIAIVILSIIIYKKYNGYKDVI